MQKFQSVNSNNLFRFHKDCLHKQSTRKLFTKQESIIYTKKSHIIIRLQLDKQRYFNKRIGKLFGFILSDALRKFS